MREAAWAISGIQLNKLLAEQVPHLIKGSLYFYLDLRVTFFPATQSKNLHEDDENQKTLEIRGFLNNSCDYSPSFWEFARAFVPAFLIGTSLHSTCLRIFGWLSKRINLLALSISRGFILIYPHSLPDSRETSLNFWPLPFAIKMN